MILTHVLQHVAHHDQSASHARCAQASPLHTPEGAADLRSQSKLRSLGSPARGQRGGARGTEESVAAGGRVSLWPQLPLRRRSQGGLAMRAAMAKAMLPRVNWSAAPPRWRLWPPLTDTV